MSQVTGPMPSEKKTKNEKKAVYERPMMGGVVDSENASNPSDATMPAEHGKRASPRVSPQATRDGGTSTPRFSHQSTTEPTKAMAPNSTLPTPNPIVACGGVEQ